MTSNESSPSGGEILLYQTADGDVRVECLFQDETIWLPQKAIAGLFGAERSVVTKHLGNIFKEGELAEESVCATFSGVRPRKTFFSGVRPRKRSFDVND